MRLALIAVGRLKTGPERELCARYFDRLGPVARGAGFSSFDALEVSESKARRPLDRKAEEAAALRALLPGGAFVVALDERGRSFSSETFAIRLAQERDHGRGSFALVIGGPDGLSEELMGEASLKIAFGAMTWPHQFARFMAAEQLYRAVTILTGHPYHRG